MNLISCTGCGVVLDKDQLVFPEIRDEDTGCLKDDASAIWDGDKYVAFTNCPVCKTPIFENA